MHLTDHDFVHLVHANQFLSFSLVMPTKLLSRNVSSSQKYFVLTISCSCILPNISKSNLFIFFGFLTLSTQLVNKVSADEVQRYSSIFLNRKVQHRVVIELNSAPHQFDIDNQTSCINEVGIQVRKATSSAFCRIGSTVQNLQLCCQFEGF